MQKILKSFISLNSLKQANQVSIRLEATIICDSIISLQIFDSKHYCYETHEIKCCQEVFRMGYNNKATFFLMSYSEYHLTLLYLYQKQNYRTCERKFIRKIKENQ